MFELHSPVQLVYHKKPTGAKKGKVEAKSEDKKKYSLVSDGFADMETIDVSLHVTVIQSQYLTHFFYKNQLAKTRLKTAENLRTS